MSRTAHREWAGTTAASDHADVARARWLAWSAYPAVAILSLVIVVLVMQLWRANSRLPFAYHGEALYNGLLVKGILEYGWHLSNPALGAPTGLDLRDVPMSDNNLHFALIRPLALVTSNYARAMNAYFLLTFPLTALAALYVFRQFGLATWPALCGSLLYAFLPFHFARGEQHLFLAAYYPVPLAVMVALWIMRGAVTPAEPHERGSRGRPSRAKLLASAIICVVLASSGVYYAFFACFFFLVAGVVLAVRQGRGRALVVPLALVALTSAVLTAHYLPSILHLSRYGDTLAVRRSPVDAETYGLSISQLLLPTTGHRLSAVVWFKDVVNSERGSNESDGASLGVIGSLGFLALLGSLLIRQPVPRPRDDGVGPGLLADLRLLNLSAVLLGTIGGFGSLVALLITSKIRAYNRISIYIAFFSLFAVVVAADYVYRRYGRGRGRQMAFMGGLAALLGLGLLDQTSPRAVPDYAKIAFEYGNDDAFVQRLEAAMPRGAMIFQLPVISFPEHLSVNLMQDYDHARGYLHARHLRWSYGAMRGRDGEAWQQWLADKPVPELIEALAAAGFSGLYLNRHGYRDGAARLSAEISRALDQSPFSSEHGRLLFFDLRPYGERLRARHSPEAWMATQEAALHPLLMNWQNGCSDLESDPQGPPGNTFRWCSSAGAWRLINGGRQARRVTLEMTLVSPHEGDVWIESSLLSERLRIGHAGRALSKTISIPPGDHALNFRCTAPRLMAPADRRELVFRVVNFRAVPVAP
jgi:phosphoglycerol transferase